MWSLPKTIEHLEISLRQVVSIAFLVLLFSASPAIAQQEISVTATPPRLELEALPGATIQEVLKIKNDTDTEMVFEVNLTDFIVNDNQGTPIAVSQKVSGRWSLANWTIVSPKKVVLKPDQSQIIDLLITLPEDALSGGHYAMVTYTPSLENTLEDTSGSAITQKVGTLIYLNTIGDVVESLNLKEFSVDNKFQEYGPINIFAEIENLGDVHLKPAGTITLTNWFNQEVAIYDLEENNIFPFTSRTYQLEIPGKWRLGKYTATINASARDSNAQVDGLIYLWIIPYKELSMISLAVIILIVLATRKKKPPLPTKEPVNPEEPIITPPLS